MSCLQVRSVICDFCPNYDLIIDYVDNDVLTQDIVNEYRHFLTSNNDLADIHHLDFIVGQYVKDDKFYNFVHHNQIEFNDKFVFVLDMLNCMYQKYECVKHNDTNETKWL